MVATDLAGVVLTVVGLFACVALPSRRGTRRRTDGARRLLA